MYGVIAKGEFYDKGKTRLIRMKRNKVNGRRYSKQIRIGAQIKFL